MVNAVLVPEPLWRGPLRALPAVLLCVAGCAEAGATPHEMNPSTLVRQVDSLRVDDAIPGLAMAVVVEGQVLYQGGFGTTDVSGGAPVTANTPFNIASVTKPISAVVALRLQERGVLDLDRPLTTYRRFDEFCEAVTAEGGLFFSDWACTDPNLTMRHVLSMTSNGTPGTRFFYNPVAFSWMSRPIAEVADLGFSDLVTREILEPLGMDRSARIFRDRPLPDPLATDLALPHAVGPDGTAERSAMPPPQGDGAAGGIISTVADLALFDVALDEGRLLSDASRTEMWTPAGPTIPYGIGWFTREVLGHRVVWHTGLWEEAYSALYLKVPERGATLVLLANSDGLRWPNDLDEAALERSPYATAFLQWLDAATP